MPPISRRRNIVGDAMTTARTSATIEDLYKIEGKAELINGGDVFPLPP